jgi:pyruvate,orthophosphate dikinase
VIAATRRRARRDGQPFPQDPREQLQGARDAVFKSWMNPRAIDLPQAQRHPARPGHAVNVQAMVFGNMGDTSATGVGFTRNPSTGAQEFYGEFLQNAQGEDVVAGIRTPHPIAELEKVMPKAYSSCARSRPGWSALQGRPGLRVHDPGRTSSTCCQTRNGKRTGLAAVQHRGRHVRGGPSSRSTRRS